MDVLCIYKFKKPLFSLKGKAINQFGLFIYF
jgi:hypothetical protein